MDANNYSQGEMARVLGKSRPSINESLRLLDLLPEIQEACRTSDTPKSVLLEIARCETPDEQRQAWEQAVNGWLTVREARERKQRGSAPVPRSPSEVALRKGQAFFRSLERLPPEDIRGASLVDLVARIYRLVSL